MMGAASDFIDEMGYQTTRKCVFTYIQYGISRLRSKRLFRYPPNPSQTEFPLFPSPFSLPLTQCANPQTQPGSKNWPMTP